MNLNYRSDIDGLRAIAILAVFIYHAFPDALPGGFIGVDIFFVISGYLISFAIFAGIDSKDFSFSGFYARRIRRIFPALVLVLVATYIAGLLILLPVELTRLGKNIASIASFTLNFILKKETGYFDAAGEHNVILHLWSLCIEEQFYLLFPPIFLITSKLKFNRLAVIVAIILGSFFLNISMIETQATAAFYLPTTRFWELAAGSLLAATLPNNTLIKQRIASTLLAATGLVMIFCGIFLIDKSMQFPGWLALIPVIGACFILSAQGENRFSNILSHHVMVWIGKISYPLYLWHYPIFAYLRIYESGEPSINVMLTGMATSVILAWLTYMFIEYPIRFGRIRMAPSKIVIGGLVAALLLVGIIAKLTQRERGFSQRVNGQHITMLTQINEFKGGVRCLNKDWGKDATCTISDPNYPPTVALIGDSHADHFYAGVADYVTTNGGNLIDLSGAGCLPLIGIRTRQVKGDPEYCGDFIGKVFNYLESTPKIKTIILAARGPITLTGKTFGEDEVAGRYIDSDMYPDAKTQKELFSQALDATLSKLIANGKKVVLILDNPELGFNPELCSSLPLIRKTREFCTINRTEVEIRNADYRDLMKKAASKYHNVEIVDTFSTLCDEFHCYGRLNGKMLYRDNNHLTTFGSKLLTPLYRF